MKVRTIQQSGAASLIEYVTGDRSLRRVYVPGASIIEGECPQDLLEQGIEYGLPWEEVLVEALGVTPEIATRAAREMRRRGLWVTGDLRRNPEQVIAALQAAFGASYQRILAAAEHYDKES